jgi:hypothetical protein
MARRVLLNTTTGVNVKENDMDIQRLCKNVASPNGSLFAASRCLSLLRASISCKPALCLGRDFLDFVWRWVWEFVRGDGEGSS